MKKFILNIMALVLIAGLFNSCLEDPEPAALEASADVFGQKIVEAGVEKVAPVFWVMGNKELGSVTVAGPGDETWDLEKDSFSERVFNHSPGEGDYAALLDGAGTYTFTVSSTQAEEAPVTVTDELEEEELGAMSVSAANFVNNRLEVEWEKLDGAEGYLIRLYDDNDQLVFVSPQVAGTFTQLSFGPSDTGWVTTSINPQVGEYFRMELVAILYESGVTVNKEYNIQYISIASEDIIWGETSIN